VTRRSFQEIPLPKKGKRLVKRTHPFPWDEEDEEDDK